MPTPTYTPLATVTLGSSASSVTFSSIPATFRDLVFIFGGVGASGFDIQWRANGDTGANYTFVQAGFGVSAGATPFSNTSTLALAGYVAPSASSGITHYLDYSATDKHKTSLSRGNLNTDFINMAASRYASTSAITSLTFFGGTFNAGSVFSLYGIAS